MNVTGIIGLGKACEVCKNTLQESMKNIKVLRERLHKGLTDKIDYGGHERGMRSGTMNVTGIIGLGKACEVCKNTLQESMKNIKVLRERLHKGLTDKIDYLVLNGHPENRLPGILNLSFCYIEGESLMMGIEDIAVSSGSACTSASLEPSYVLRALGVGDEAALVSFFYPL